MLLLLLSSLFFSVVVIADVAAVVVVVTVVDETVVVETAVVCSVVISVSLETVISVLSSVNVVLSVSFFNSVLSIFVPHAVEMHKTDNAAANAATFFIKFPFLILNIMYVQLIEWYFNIILIKFPFNFFFQIKVNCPIIFGFNPWSYIKYYCTVIVSCKKYIT